MMQKQLIELGVEVDQLLRTLDPAGGLSDIAVSEPRPAAASSRDNRPRLAPQMPPMKTQ